MQLHFLNSIAHSLTSTFIHSVWQGLVIALIAALIMIMARRASSTLRYNLLCILFFLFLSVVTTTFIIELVTAGNVSAKGLSIIDDSNNIGSSQHLTTVFQEINIFLLANSGWIVLSWSIIFVFKVTRTFFDLKNLSRLRNTYTSEVSNEWKERLEVLNKKLGIRKTVLLMESALIKVPVILGHFKPVVLIPVGVLNNLPVSDVEAVLIHELAHIKRHDFAINFIQYVAGAIFFFNPGFIWLSSLLREERENCCDDIAISNSGDKAAYVGALVSFKEFSLQQPQMVLGLFGKHSMLFQRVTRIVDNRNRRLSTGECSFFMVSVMLLALLIPMATTTVKSHTQKAKPFPFGQIAVAVPIKNEVPEHTSSGRMLSKDDTRSGPAESGSDRQSKKSSFRSTFIKNEAALSMENIVKHEKSLHPPPHYEHREEIQDYIAETEMYRAEAEQHRIHAEEQRQIASAHREKSMENRKIADQHRAQAEIHRRAADEHRKEAEVLREKAEAHRKELTKT